MTSDPDPLRALLSFYRDLGVTSLYRHATGDSHPAAEAAVVEVSSARETPAADSPPELSYNEVAEFVPPKKTPLPEAPTLFVVAPEAKRELLDHAVDVPPDDTLLRVRQDIGDCTRCRLHEGRNKLVFGAGPENARVVFVGEGPGADEDASGEPFVGKAGQLLTQMIDNTASREGLPMRRADVYICNVVKCRPPENRAPRPDESGTCGQFLVRQLLVIQPKVIIVMGNTATQHLLQVKEGVTKLRGRWHDWRGIPVMVTWHPSYLLRQVNQTAKRESWEDLKSAFHRAYDPPGQS